MKVKLFTCYWTLFPVIVLVLNAWDWLATVEGIQRGYISEANPLVAPILDSRPWLLLIFKLLLYFILGILVPKLGPKQYHWGYLTISLLVIGAYMAVGTYHAYWISLVLYR
ncbi:DUF5658 family protein [Heliobacterium chlorum]|uniref:DUF5658 family protein n=1 Tax=Heliobacterium chlorum TaxID=2698 RepID=UPI003C6BFA9D